MTPGTLLLSALLAGLAPDAADFERHVMGLLSRAGCNAGGCHGSFQGKNGFRLSLFGADPAFDHAALTREGHARRVDPLDPDGSLLLLKATGRVPHGGGRRVAPGSWQYRLLRDWVAGGAARRPGSGDVAELTLTPGEYATVAPGEAGTVRALARFADGSQEDVTRLCDFRVQDESVAVAAEPGTVRAGRPGDTALLVTYRGHVRSIRVLVPTLGPRADRAAPESNFIDREVFAKLRLLNVTPSELSDDAEFLRRVTLDAVGGLPTPEEVRAFLADRSPGKRGKKIEALLAHPRHADLWATRFSDVTGNNTPALRAPTNQARGRYSQLWHDWFRRRVADNVPYDEIVHGVLCATSRDGKGREEWAKGVAELEAVAEKGFVPASALDGSLDHFWKVGVAPSLEDYAERTAAAFLGVRLECAQCHKHPFDRWTQADYRSYANVFGHVVIGTAADTRAVLGKTVLGKGAGLGQEIYVGGKGRWLPPPGWLPRVKEVIPQPNGKKLIVLEEPPPRLPARALGGPAIAHEKGRDSREALFAWMRDKDNPYFARSFVNRVWAHYFGIGIVHPADDFSLANPPTNARLLDALARDFVASGYDVRRLERTILQSRTYQLSSAMNATNRLDRNNFSHGYLRPLLAEVAIDAIADATGVPDDFGPDAPAGKRAVEVGSVRLRDVDLSYALRTFGRPDRLLACDCERAAEASLSQTLYRMADPAVTRKFVAAKLEGKGRLATLLEGDKTAEEVVEELFLATLSRFPTRAEAAHFAEHRARKGRDEACADALWALLNAREFILNH